MKKLLNYLDINHCNICNKIKGVVLILLFILLVSFITSCAPKHVEMPSFADKDLNKLLDVLSDVSAIEAVISMEYEKQHNLMQGDASLAISENHIDLKIYYLGFLAGYLKESNGAVTASQKMDKNKSAILTEGLRNSFLWWKIKDYNITDDGEYYTMKNYNRKILVDKRTLLPVQQTIELYNGDELKVIYDSPAMVEQTSSADSDLSSLGLWYQSRMRIELNNHLLKIKIKSYNLISKSDLAP